MKTNSFDEQVDKNTRLPRVDKISSDNRSSSYYRAIFRLAFPPSYRVPARSFFRGALLSVPCNFERQRAYERVDVDGSMKKIFSGRNLECGRKESVPRVSRAKRGKERDAL